MSLAIEICILILMLFGPGQNRDGNAIGVEKLKNLIVNFLSEKFTDERVNYLVDLKSRIDMNLDGCEVRVIQKSGQGYRGYQTFKVRICSGDSAREIFVQALVRTFEDVLIAKRDLKRDEVVDSDGKIFDMFSVERVETTFLRDGFIRNAGAVSGKKIKKFIRKGEIIFDDYLEDLPMVRSGQKVRVIARAGNVKVEISGIAKGDGRLNDLIRVLNPGSGRVFYGKVVGEGIVEVEIEN